MYCAQNESLPHSALLSFVCPADRSFCPNSQSEIEIKLPATNTPQSRTFSWPDLAAGGDSNHPEDWHCKYKVKPMLAEEDVGYIVLDIKKEGFSNFTNIIIEAHNLFLSNEE